MDDLLVKNNNISSKKSKRMLTIDILSDTQRLVIEKRTKASNSNKHLILHWCVHNPNLCLKKNTKHMLKIILSIVNYFFLIKIKPLKKFIKQ